MFINSNPRWVSNGFEAFVCNQIAGSLYEKGLVEMTNNEANTWSVQPTAPVTNTWSGNLGDFGSNETFLVQPAYGGYFQSTASVPQNQGTDMSKVFCPGILQGQNQQNRRSVAYQDPSPDMNCYEHPSPMLGHDYSQLSLGRGRGSFVEFSNSRQLYEDIKYTPSTDSASSSFTSTIYSSLPSSYLDETSNFGQPLDISRTSPDEIYSCYSPKTMPASLNVPRSSSMRNVQQERAKWFPGNTKMVKQNNQPVYDLNMSFDGLPKFQDEQQPTQYGPWAPASTPVNTKWTQQLTEPKTVSPKALTLNASAPPVLPSPGRASIMGLSDSITATSITDNASELRGHGSSELHEPQQPVRRPRQMLPSGSGNFHSHVQASSSDVFPSRNLRKRSVKAIEPENHARRSSPPTKLAPTTKSRVQRPKDAPRISPQQTLVPKSASSQQPKPASGSSKSSTKANLDQADHIRTARDNYLIKSKLAGMSYRDIREQGRFTEAESTLRGRYRTLTKAKSARVRRPEWNDNDIRLLKKAVRKLSKEDSKGKLRTPWKQVAEYISDHGGSYHFGNATCHKRWEELEESG